jgi:hypothetical protein
VLATELGATDCGFQTIEAIQAAVDASIERHQGDNHYRGTPALTATPVSIAMDRLDIPMYSIDPLVRRSEPLQQTKQARDRDMDAQDRISA